MTASLVYLLALTLSLACFKLAIAVETESATAEPVLPICKIKKNSENQAPTSRLVAVGK